MAWGTFLKTIGKKAYKRAATKKGRQQTFMDVKQGMRQTGQTVMTVGSQVGADIKKTAGTAQRTKDFKKTMTTAGKTKTAGDMAAAGIKVGQAARANPIKTGVGVAAGGGVVYASNKKKKKGNS